MPVESIAPTDLETVGCSLCGATTSKPLFSIRGFPIVACTSCGLRYVSRRLKAGHLLDLYSQEDYFKSSNSRAHGYPDYAAEKESIIATFQRRLDWILSASGRTRPGRLLDVGCALGFSLDYAIGQGWDAYGIEPSRYAAEIAIRRLGNRVTQGTLDTQTFQPASFDTLLLWDVIEHVPDPLATLKQTRDLLAPGGFLSLITPDCDSLVARVLGKRWMEYAKPTEHITFFSMKTLQDAIGRAGFKRIAATTAGKFISLHDLLERLSDHIPLFPAFKTQQTSGIFSKTLYVNPKDKLHLLVQKE